MNRKEDELIQQIAFGEDVSRASANGDVNERELKIWNQLRQDLHRLREVPEPQIGIDRIRHAILNDDLVTKRSYALPWAAGIAAASAVAASAIWVTMKNAQTSEFSNDSTIAQIQPVAPKNPNQLIWRDRPAPQQRDNIVLAHEEGSASRIERPRNRTRWGSSLLAMGTSSRHSGKEATVARLSRGPDVILPDPPVEITSNNENAEPMVIIDSTRDEQTGANIANEVETKGDIVIGG